MATQVSAAEPYALSISLRLKTASKVGTVRMRVVLLAKSTQRSKVKLSQLPS